MGDCFGHKGAFSVSSTEELAKARSPPEKRNETTSDDVGRPATVLTTPLVAQERVPSSENTPDPSPASLTVDGAQAKFKTARKRTKWSQKETEDLLVGVSRFGIGRWKQILGCTDFSFQHRTAVDLKDRFRVCRPGEGLKARKIAVVENSTDARPADARATESSPEKGSNQVGTEASNEDTAVNGQDTVKAKDIYGPFMKSRRRARREFSDEDDRNLLKGFKRHGPVWHAMRDDFELGFGMRHPTDLRDRFRIRYPDQFAKAGFKLKPKEARALREAEETEAQKAQASRPPSPAASRTTQASDKAAVRANVPAIAQTPAVATASSASTRPTFDLITDFTFDEDEGDRSPIILNRNILQWADENSASLPTTTPTTTTMATAMATATVSSSTLPSSDYLYNPFVVAPDGLHINPLATLKLPSTAHWGYLNAPAAASLASLPPPAPPKHAGSSAVRAQQEMRTPNLPNIVFPYVPNASARNAVHNLPAPADILSERQSGAGEGYVWIG